MTLKKKPFEIIVRKGENAGTTSIFSCCHNVFYPSLTEFFFFNYIYFVDQSKNLSFGKEVKRLDKSDTYLNSLPNDKI